MNQHGDDYIIDFTKEGSDLDFGDFDLSRDMGDRSNGRKFQRNSANKISPNQEAALGGISSSKFYQIEYYTQFFHVDTSDIVQRILATLEPWSDFSRIIDGNPDLYGPIWITVTTIFVLFVKSTLAPYNKTGGLMDSFFNTESLVKSSSIIISYSVIVPMASNTVVKYYKKEGAYLKLVDIFTYGLVFWIIAGILCFIPSKVFRLLVSILTFVYMYIFTCRSLNIQFEDSFQKRALSATLFPMSFIMQAVLAILIKIFFL